MNRRSDRSGWLLLALLALALGLSGCGGPILVFPGGALSGPVEPAPTSFDFANDAGTIQLETNPKDPYSVNIACAIVDERMYISAGDTRTTWVDHMEADPRVRLRIEGLVYELSARRVVDDAEMRAFAAEWTKRPWARDPLELGEVWVYELTPRDAG